MGNWKANREKDRERSQFDNKFEVLKLKCVTAAGGTPIAEDAKVARIRFITDAADAESMWVHTIPKRTRLGKMFSTDYYCLAQDNLECPYCSNLNKDISKVKRKLLFKVYVYYVLHVANNAEKSWEQVDYFGTKMFKEQVNAVRFLYQGPGFNNSVENKFLNWEKRFKTLTDRDYEWTREGFTMSETVYDLVPDDAGKSPVSDEVKTVMDASPSLQEFIDNMKPSAGQTGTVEETDADIEKQVDDMFK
jgi:hypothetical protein